MLTGEPQMFKIIAKGNDGMNILVQMCDDDDGCTYSHHLSVEDAKKILDAENEILIELPSIGGNMCLKEKTAAIMYQSSGGHGSIYTDYALPKI